MIGTIETFDAATALLVAAAGWLLGYVSAWLSGRLLERDGLASGARRPLVADPLVQAGVALVWVLLLVAFGPGWRWLAAALLAAALVQVSVTDLRHRYVYLPVAGAGLVAGLLGAPLVHDASWWTAPVGAVAGGATFGLLYAVGRWLYRGREPLARGDVVIAVMVGAMAGPRTPTALVWGAVLSGLLGVVVMLRARSVRAYMPYGPGLCLGGLVTLFLR